MGTELKASSLAEVQMNKNKVEERENLSKIRWIHHIRGPDTKGTRKKKLIVLISGESLKCLDLQWYLYPGWPSQHVTAELRWVSWPRPWPLSSGPHQTPWSPPPSVPPCPDVSSPRRTVVGGGLGNWGGRLGVHSDGLPTGEPRASWARGRVPQVQKREPNLWLPKTALNSHTLSEKGALRLVAP